MNYYLHHTNEGLLLNQSHNNISHGITMHSIDEAQNYVNVLNSSTDIDIKLTIK